MRTVKTRPSRSRTSPCDRLPAKRPKRASPCAAAHAFARRRTRIVLGLVLSATTGLLAGAWGCGPGKAYDVGRTAEQRGEAQTAYDAYCEAGRRHPGSGAVSAGIKRTAPQTEAYWQSEGTRAMEEGRCADAWRMLMRVLEVNPRNASAARLVRQLEFDHALQVADVRRDYQKRGSAALAIAATATPAPAREQRSARLAAADRSSKPPSNPQFAQPSEPRPEPMTSPPTVLAYAESRMSPEAEATRTNAPKPPTPAIEEPTSLSPASVNRAPRAGDEENDRPDRPLPSSPSSDSGIAAIEPSKPIVHPYRPTQDRSQESPAERTTRDRPDEPVQVAQAGPARSSDQAQRAQQEGASEAPVEPVQPARSPEAPAEPIQRAQPSETPAEPPRGARASKAPGKTETAKPPSVLETTAEHAAAQKPTPAQSATPEDDRVRPRQASPKQPQAEPRRTPRKQDREQRAASDGKAPPSVRRPAPAKQQPGDETGEALSASRDEFLAVHTLSKKNHLYPQRLRTVEGVIATLKGTDDDLDCDIDLHEGKKRIKKIRGLEIGQSEVFRTRSGKLYRLTILSIHHKSHTVRLGIKLLG